MWYPYKSRIRTIAGAFGFTFRELGFAYRSLRDGERGDPARPAPKLDRVEDQEWAFESEYARLGLDEERLGARLRQLRIMFWLMMALAQLAFCSGLAWGLVFGGDEWVTAVLIASTMCYPFMVGLKYGWRHWQASCRRMMRFGEYLTASPVIPQDPRKSRPRGRRALSRAAATSLVLAIAVATLLSSSDALAQATQEAMNAIRQGYASDRATYWLRSIFGATLFPFSGGVQIPETVMGVYARYFNVGIAAVGSLMLSYNVAAGVAQTAHDGEILGRRWSSLWAPLRLTLGAGSMLPVVGGYCFAQVIVATAACWGVGLANYVWTKTINLSFEQGLPLAATQPPKSMEQIRAIMEIQVCKHYLNNRASVLKEQVPAVVPSDRQFVPERTVSQSIVSTITLGNYGNPEPLKIRSVEDVKGQKGTFSWSYDGAGAAEGKPVSKWGSEVCGRIDLPTVQGGNVMMQPILTAQATRVDQLLADLDAYASWIAMTPYSGGRMKLELPEASSIVPLIESHEAALANASQSVMREVRGSSTKATELKNAMARDGWTGAGTWYMQISRLNGEYLTAMNIAPRIKGPNWDMLVSERYIGQDAAEVKSMLDRWWTSVVPSLRKGLRNGTSYSDVITYSSEVSRTDGPSGSVMLKTTQNEVTTGFENGIGGTIMGAFDWMTSTEGRQMWTDPLGSLVTMGDLFLKVGWSAGTMSVGANVVSFGSSFIPGGFGEGISKATGAVGSLLTLVFFVFAAAGTFLAFILPMMPYVAWVMALLLWVTLVAKAVIFAPIWAVAHLRMEGDGLAGHAAEAGYEIIFNIFMMPVLMLGGLLAGSAIFAGGAYFVMSTALPMMRDAIASSGIGALFAAIAYTIMLVVIMVTIAEKCFGMITEFPAQLGRWFGGKGEEMTVADQGSRESRMAFLGSFSKVEGGVDRAAQMRGPRGFGSNGGRGSGNSVRPTRGGP